MTSNFNDFSNRDMDERFTTDKVIRHDPNNFDTTTTNYSAGTGGMQHGFEGGNRHTAGGDYTTSTGMGGVGMGTGHQGGHDFATSGGDRYGGVAGGMSAARGEHGHQALRDAPPMAGTNNLERGAGTGWDGAGNRPDYDNGLRERGVRGDFSDDIASGGRRAAGVQHHDPVSDPAAATQHKPTMGEKIKGNVEVLTGKLTGNPAKVAEGTALKTGSTNSHTTSTSARDDTRY